MFVQCRRPTSVCTRLQNLNNEKRPNNARHNRRTGQHPLGGGQTEFCPNRFGGGGGVVAGIARDPYSVGGGSSRNFPRPIRWDKIFSVNCSNMYCVLPE